MTIPAAIAATRDDASESRNRASAAAHGGANVRAPRPFRRNVRLHAGGEGGLALGRRRWIAPLRLGPFMTVALEICRRAAASRKTCLSALRFVARLACLFAPASSERDCWRGKPEPSNDESGRNRCGVAQGFRRVAAAPWGMGRVDNCLGSRMIGGGMMAR